MSNHSGSYMLNGVMTLLKKNGIFDYLGKEKTKKLISDVVEISDRYDCNPHEILEGIGEELGICCYCLVETQNSQEELCKNCGNLL